MPTIETLSDGHAVREDGDDIVIETPYGEARFSLADANEHADEQLRTTEDWMDLPLDERWKILFEEVRTTVREANANDQLV